jgi:glucose 1-dehydrogenase
MKLTNRVALVTGSSQGIGEAIALRLAEEGADVVVNYRNDPEQAASVVRKIEIYGQRAFAVQADLSESTAVHRLIDESLGHFQRLDLLVNNVGIEKHAPFLQISETDYDDVLAVNLKSVFFLSQLFARHLRDTQRPGKIINISSVHEELPFPNFASYATSKGALKMLMRTLAVELAPLGITVNNVAPGAIETPIDAKVMQDKEKLAALLNNIPLRRMGQSSDVAGAVTYLASTDADYVTGSTLVVDGGLLRNYQEQ